MTKIKAILFIPLLLLLTSCTDINFNSEEWKNWKVNESNTHRRWDMANDLINNYDLMDKSHDEILELLGKPGNDISNSEDEYYYDLGPCRRGIDFGSLHIEFKDGKVSLIKKYCH